MDRLRRADPVLATTSADADDADAQRAQIRPQPQSTHDDAQRRNDARTAHTHDDHKQDATNKTATRCPFAGAATAEARLPLSHCPVARAVAAADPAHAAAAAAAASCPAGVVSASALAALVPESSAPVHPTLSRPPSVEGSGGGGGGGGSGSISVGGCPFAAGGTGGGAASPSNRTLPEPADQLTHRELQTFMRLLPDAVLIVSPGGVVFDCNTHALRMFGYTRSRLVGQSVEQLVPPQFRAQHASLVRGSFVRNEVREMGARKGVRGRHARGHMLDLSINLSPFMLLPTGPANLLASPARLATGPFWVDPARAGWSAASLQSPEYTSFMLCVVRDLTDRTRLIVSSQRALNRAQLMDGFLRLINHETRTSLNSIQHAIQELSEQIDKETADEAAQYAAHRAAAAACPIATPPPLFVAAAGPESRTSPVPPSFTSTPAVRDDSGFAFAGGSILSPVGEADHESPTVDHTSTSHLFGEQAMADDSNAARDQRVELVDSSTHKLSWSVPGSVPGSASVTPSYPASRTLSTASSAYGSPLLMSPRKLPLSSSAIGSVDSAVLSSSTESQRSARKQQLRAHVSTVQSAAERMGVLLGNMLDLQHLQSGSMIENISTFDPKHLLMSVCHSVAKVAAAQRVQLQCFASESLPSVTGNAELLSKCLLSLTDNAIKASKPGQRVVLRCQLNKPDPIAKTKSAAALAAETAANSNSPQRVAKALLTEVASSSFHYASTPPPMAMTARRLPQPAQADARVELYFQVLDEGAGFGGLAIERLPAPLPMPTYVTRKGKQPTNDPRAAEEAEETARAAATHQLPAHRVVVVPAAPELSLDSSVPLCADALALSSIADADDVASLDLSTTRGTANGLGLGISIARLAVRGLNGTFQIISQPRKDSAANMTEQQKLARGLTASLDAVDRSPAAESPPVVTRSHSVGSVTSGAHLCLCRAQDGIGAELCGSCLLASRWTSICQLSAPFTRCEVSHPILSDEAQRDALARMRDPSTAAMRDAFHILVVEDNHINARILMRLLAKAGFTQITRAENGQLALQAVSDKAAKAEAYNQRVREERGDGEPGDAGRRDSPSSTAVHVSVSSARPLSSSPVWSLPCPQSVSDFSCILLDIEMPVMDGFTAAETLRNQGCEVPLIALTANATLECQLRCSQAGINVFLTKPIIADSLIFTLAALQPFNMYPLEISPFFLRAKAD